jgi:hypothetical protein
VVIAGPPVVIAAMSGVTAGMSGAEDVEDVGVAGSGTAIGSGG